MSKERRPAAPVENTKETVTLQDQLLMHIGIYPYDKNECHVEANNSVLTVSFVKAFQRNVGTALAEAFEKLAEDSAFENVVRAGNTITADLKTPVGDIRKVVVRGDKDM